jgi:hypothetical protein
MRLMISVPCSRNLNRNPGQVSVRLSRSVPLTGKVVQEQLKKLE